MIAATSPAERRALERAIALGEAARLETPPNPWVGCVLLRDGRVVAEGRTRPPGGPHAEAVALTEAGSAARGATAVVTLEPCAHTGRTPPCAAALIDAGVARVVIALDDPDPVSGTGRAVLRDAGVEVVDAADDPEARELVRGARESLAPYLHQRATGRAFVHGKIAQSLDARMLAGDGAPRWLTGPEARADAHALRARSQAVVVGAGTALADRPRLDVRDAPAPTRPPRRVVVDGRGRVPAEGPLFDVSVAPTTVVTTDRAEPSVRAGWRERGAQVVVVDVGPHDGVDLAAAFGALADEGVVQALVEGGPTLLGACAAAGLLDRLSVYVAPVVLGTGAPPSFVPAHRRLNDERRSSPQDLQTSRDGGRRALSLREATALGADLRVDLAAA